MTRPLSPPTPTLFLGVTALLLLGACGGGGAPGAATVGSASLTGQVLEVDGATSDLAGVEVALLETGKSVVTTSDGSFDLGAVPSGTLTLVVAADPVAMVMAQSMGDMGPGGGGNGGPRMGGFSDDEIDDGEDVDGPYMYVHRVQARERIHVRLRLQDGEIAEGACIREQYEERDCEMWMQGAPTSDDADVSAKLEVEVRQDRERLQVRVQDCDEGRQLELRVQDQEQNWESQGTRTCDGEGEARWETDTSEGGRLPFRARTLCDLTGNRWQVCDAQSGTCLCEGRMPEVPAYPGSDEEWSSGACWRTSSTKAGGSTLQERTRQEIQDPATCDGDGDRDRDCEPAQ